MLSSNAVDCPMGCPIKILEFIKFVTFTAGNPYLLLNSRANLCVCSHMTGTPKMGSFTSHKPPSRCCHKYMFSAILGLFDSKTIVHTHLSRRGPPRNTHGQLTAKLDTIWSYILNY